MEKINYIGNLNIVDYRMPNLSLSGTKDDANSKLEKLIQIIEDKKVIKKWIEVVFFVYIWYNTIEILYYC